MIKATSTGARLSSAAALLLAAAAPLLARAGEPAELNCTPYLDPLAGVDLELCQGPWLDDKDGLPIINMRDGGLRGWGMGDGDGTGQGDRSIRSIDRWVRPLSIVTQPPPNPKHPPTTQLNQTGEEYRWIVGQVTNNDAKKGVCKLSFDIAGTHIGVAGLWLCVRLWQAARAKHACAPFSPPPIPLPPGSAHPPNPNNPNRPDHNNSTHRHGEVPRLFDGPHLPSRGQEAGRARAGAYELVFVDVGSIGKQAPPCRPTGSTDRLTDWLTDAAYVITHHHRASC